VCVLCMRVSLVSDRCDRIVESKIKKNKWTATHNDFFGHDGFV
jgi:hypothetical protein